LLGMIRKAGRKIDEPEHVSSKNNILNFKSGAWRHRSLCLSFIIIFFALPVPALAQPTPLYNRTPVEVPPSQKQGALAQMEIRLQQLENQVRSLTGKVEEQAFEINRLRNLNEQPAGKPATPVSNRQPAAPDTAQADTQRRPVNDPLNLGFGMPAPTGMQTVVPGQNANTDVDTATARYEQAFAALKLKQYEESRKGFEEFVKDKPNHILAPNAKYWLGETFYAEGQFKQAARTFAEGFQAYPKSAKSPDILLKLGMSLAQLGKTSDACVALSQLPVKFPAGPESVLQRGEAEMDKLGCDS